MTAAEHLLSAASVADEQPENRTELLSVGTVLDARYRVVRSIGRGGMGQVYEGRQIGLDRRVAIKVLRPQVEASAAARKRFEREARAMARIESEHVAMIFDFGLGPEAQPYLVMEYLDGQDLRALLREQNALPAPRAARLIHGACRGLVAAHEQGVIHRDLKPENLFVVVRDGREVCKVLDFGLAKLRATNRSELPTQAGIPLGTLHYMSPEQARGDVDIDERADVYGCAAVMYELLTGRRPHAAESAHGLLYKIIHECPKRVDEVFAYVPADLADVVQLGLARNRLERPESIRAFAALLEPFIGGGPGAAVHLPSDNSETSSDTEPQRAGAPTTSTTRSKGTKHRLGFLAAGALLGGGASWWFAPGPAATPQPVPLATHTVAQAAARSPVATSSTSTPVDSRYAASPIPSGAPPTEPAKGPSSQRPQPTAPKTSRPTPSKAAAGPASSFERRNPYD